MITCLFTDTTSIGVIASSSAGTSPIFLDPIETFSFGKSGKLFDGIAYGLRRRNFVVLDAVIINFWYLNSSLYSTNILCSLNIY